MSDPLVQIQRAPYIERPIDNTALDAFMTCPRKYWLGMVQHRRRSGPPSPAIAYGSVWHTIMETHYKTGGNREAVVAAAAAKWTPHSNPDDHRTLDRALAAYEAYVRLYGEHDEEAKSWGTTVGYPEHPVVENSTELWWEGAYHPYTGKIDRIYEHHGQLFVEDHKTTSQLGAYYFRQFDPSNQMMGYAWLAQLLIGRPIAGVRINAHGVLKTQNKFERQTVLFAPERLVEWGRNLNAWLRRIDTAGQLMHEAAHEGNVSELDAAALAFPHNFNACAGKYGQCTYTEICTMPARVRMKVLEADFAYEPWDPLAAEDGEEG